MRLWRRQGGRGARRRERIDPFGVGEPWRQHVRAALSARARFDQTVSHLPGGPLRERMGAISARLEDAGHECWRVAQRGDALDDALSDLDVSGIRARLAAAGGSPGDGGDGEDPMVASLRAQLVVAERLEVAAGHARRQLQVMEAHLDEVVAGAAALSALAGEDTDTLGLGLGVDQVVEELAALRSALEESQEPGA